MKNCNQCGGKCVFPDGRVCLANQLAAERDAQVEAEKAQLAEIGELAGRLRAVRSAIQSHVNVLGVAADDMWTVDEMFAALDGPVPKCEGCEAAAEAKGEKE